MDNTVSMELTPAEVASLSALIDECLKILKESNESSEQRYAEIAQLKEETQPIINQVRKMLNVEETL
ncbi:MAG: hypothetical protein ACREAB_14765 [Blastocatellia bacterium]